MKKRYDLHTHTTKSDGTLSPEELLKLAKEKGLSGLSITDHDTIAAYSKEIVSLAKSYDLTLISGVEITSKHRSLNVHVLGYGFSLEDPAFKSFLEKVQKVRKERNAMIYAYLKEYGILIKNEDFPRFLQNSSSVIGRLHIAKLLIDLGHVGSIQEAFDLYLSDRGKPWQKCQKFSTESVIEAIQKAKGKAVLAHPFFLKEGRALNELLHMPFDGIEGRYANMAAYQEKKWISIAEKKGWIVTGGSDFHGSIKPSVDLGASWSEQSVIDQIFADEH